MSPWFNCRDITTLDPANPAHQSILRGYEYMHHSSTTLGPDGNTKYADTGEPYASSVTACTSCHFTGGHVPFGTPFYQSPSKYAPLPYFRPLGYKRDLEDSIIDCFRNCMNADRSPTKTDAVMRDLVAYINWVRDGVIDPVARADWTKLPPEAGPNLPGLDPGIYTDPTLPTRAVNPIGAANPTNGAALYAQQCAVCHDEDGPGLGEYRVGEERPRAPALWGLRDGHSLAAAFYRNGVLGAYIQSHMPFDTPNTLTDQQALDIAAYINAPDKDAQRTPGQAHRMFCFNDPDGIPAALRKNADWNVGCAYRNEFNEPEPFTDAQIRTGPWASITAWRNQEIARRSLAKVAPVATSDPRTLDSDDAYRTPQNTPLTVGVLANDTHPVAGQVLSVAELSRIYPATATATINANGTVTYTPPTGYSGEGALVYRVRDGNGLWSNYATVLVTVETGPAAPAQVDLRIDQFSATGDVRVSSNQSVTFRLDVRNTGTANVPSGGYGATLVGVRNGQTVYNQTIQVSDPPGDGATMFTSFPAYRPTTAGDIAWTVTVLDGDGDAGNDRATATTRVRQ